MQAHTHTTNIALGGSNNAMWHNNASHPAAGDGGVSASPSGGSTGGGDSQNLQPYRVAGVIIKT